MLVGTATTGVDAVHRQTGDFGARVQRPDVGVLGDVSVVVLDKATIRIHGHVVNAQVQGAAVFHQDFRVGPRHQVGAARHVLTIQLNVATAGAHVLDVQEVGIHIGQGHVIGLAAFGIRLGQTFTDQGREVKAQLGFHKGPDFGHIAVTRQLVVQAGHISARTGPQVFFSDGVAHVAGVFQNRAVGAHNQALLVAKTGLKLATQAGRARHVLVRLAVLTAQAHHLAQVARPVTDLTFAFDHIRAFDAAQLDGGTRSHSGRIHRQAVVQIQGCLGIGVDRDRDERVVEQIYSRRHKVFVAIEVFVLAGQQTDGFRADQFSARPNGHAVVDIGGGIGIALRCTSQAIGL